MKENETKELKDLGELGYRSAVILKDFIAELPRLTFEERQIIIREALELDNPPLSAADEALIDERLAAHHADPRSSTPLNQFKQKLRGRSQ